MGVSYVEAIVDVSELYAKPSTTWGTIAIIGTENIAPTLDIRTFSEPLRGVASEDWYNGGVQTELAKSINLAFENGAMTVKAVMATGATAALIDDAHALFDSENVHIMVISNIAATVANSQPNQIFDLFRDRIVARAAADRFRIGVAMLAPSDAGADPETIANNLTTHRMILVAHKDTGSNDVASAVAGKISEVKPWHSLCGKTITGLNITNDFTDTEIDDFFDGQTDSHPLINIITVPQYRTDWVITDGWTLDTAFTRHFIDIVRTIDDVIFELKSGLSGPDVIGEIPIDRAGMRVLGNKMIGILHPLQRRKEIESYLIKILVGEIFEKSEADLTVGEIAYRAATRASRNVEVEIEIRVKGTVHRIGLTVRFTY